MHRLRLTRKQLVRGLSLTVVGLAAIAPAASSSRSGQDAVSLWEAAPSPTAIVGYTSKADLKRALKVHPGVVLRTIPALGAAEILPVTPPRYFATATADLKGIDYVEPPVIRRRFAEPGLERVSAQSGGVLEWQYPAARVDAVPDSIKRAASSVTIAVIDTGADLAAPDIGTKAPTTYSVVGAGRDVRDTVGHGTFVAALAAGSDTNGDGIAGFGGSAKLMVVQASRSQTAFTDFDEAAAIVWAIDHGARILNLSLGGPDTSTTERDAIAYAVKHGALVVTAVGNEHAEDNPVEYPAALVQPVGSNGRGGTGLSVGASDETGARADFSSTGSHLSLVAPGTRVLSAISSTAPNTGYARVAVPGAAAGIYAFGSGTSFATPEVAGAAALVWAANPQLTAQQVAQILKDTASNHGVWNDATGYGVLDAAAAVSAATDGGQSPAPVTPKPAPAAAAATPPTARSTTGAARASASTLALGVSTRRGRAPLELVVRARLVAPGGGVVSGRRVLVQAFNGSAWRTSTAGTTDDGGKVTWSFTLDPGTYRIRARFAGDRTLRATVSRTVTVDVS